MADAGESQYLELPVHPSAASWARRHVRVTLARWRLDGLAETAELVVSELVTNAVKAGRETAATIATADGGADGGDVLAEPGADLADLASRAGSPRHRIGLDVYRSGALVVVEVWDPSRTPPALKNASLDEEGGRGLMLVDVLSEKWGYRWPVPGGKVVWCALAADADACWASATTTGDGGGRDAEQGDREQEGVGALEAGHELVDGDRGQP